MDKPLFPYSVTMFVCVCACVCVCVYTASAYDPQGLSAFLDTLSDFDQSMMKPVEDSGVLKGDIYTDTHTHTTQHRYTQKDTCYG